MSKPVATFVKVCQGFNGVAKLYKCEGGALPEYVIVSAASVMFSGPETYIFEASSEGEVTSWSELEGSYTGGLSHAKALIGAGYSVNERVQYEVVPPRQLTEG